MTWPLIVIFILAVLVMLVGMLGIIIPVLPGVPLIFAAALIYAIITGFTQITGNIILIFAILTIASLVFDYLATVLGVKRMGGSVWGMIGAFVGMIIGLMIPGVGIIGFIIGAFVGAFLLELLVGKTSRQALRAGFGSFIGFIVGGVFRFIIGAVMIGIFIYRVIFT